MDLGSILLILALALLVALFISRPFFGPKTRPSRLSTSLEDHELSSLMAERDQVINALQELDFDHALGKIPAEDYPPQRAALLQRGAEILRRLDELEGGAGAAQEPASALALGPEDRLEAVVAARRADALAGNGRGLSRPAAAAQADDEVERLLASRRRARQEKAGGFCPKCGKPVQASDRFCPKCGATL